MKFCVMILVIAMFLLGACSNKPSSDGINQDNNQHSSTASQLVEYKIELSEGNLVGNKDKITANKGDDVSIIVVSDKAIDIHLHGYDIQKHIPAHGEVKIEVNANATGRFIITSHSANDVDELESAHEEHVLVTLEIYP
mgnify:FL=1